MGAEPGRRFLIQPAAKLEPALFYNCIITPEYMRSREMVYLMDCGTCPKEFEKPWSGHTRGKHVHIRQLMLAPQQVNPLAPHTRAVEPELKFKPRFRPRHLKSFRPCWTWFWPANPGFDPAPQPWFWPALQNSRRCCCVTDKFYAMKYIGVFEPQFLFLKFGEVGCLTAQFLHFWNWKCLPSPQFQKTSIKRTKGILSRTTVTK